VIFGLLHRQHRRRWHGRDTIGPDELVTKAPLEQLTDPNLPCHRRPRHYGLASEPFRSRISLYTRAPVENRRSDAICRLGDPIRSRADLTPVVRQALLK
jgi:hypothetical protein